MGPVAIFTNDIYRKHLRPETSEKDLVRVARYTTVILGVFAILIAYLIPDVLKLINLAYTFGSAGLFFPMLGLLFWKRTTAKGAYWSMLLGGSSAVIWTLAGNPMGFASSYLGWVVGLPVLIVVSLMTEHSIDENIDLFG